jgi:uncharacterized protein
VAWGPWPSASWPSRATAIRQAEAAALVGGEVGSVEEALAGARDIVAEVVTDRADVRALARAAFAAGAVVAEGVADKITEPTKYEAYYAFREAVATIPSHRFLAIRRGEAEGVLRATVEPDGGADGVIAGMLRLAGHAPGSPWADLLARAVGEGYRRLLAPAIENDVRAECKAKSDQEAAAVFAGNLRALLLAAPLGARTVIGIDPGLRTGCKCAAVDATGKFLGTVTIYLTQGEAALERARAELVEFVRKHDPMAIAVGNGTGGREAEVFTRRTLAAAGLGERVVVAVNEAGASVYSASDLAREEFPDLDLTIRGAISIARRLQDPLAELVKVEPKAIGVGQYQHDVHAPLLARSWATSSRAASTTSASISTPPAPACSATSPASARPWPARSSRTATPTAASRRARRCARCRAWAPRPSSSAPGSCGSAAPPSPSTPPRSTPSATRSSSRWPPTSASIS